MQHTALIATHWLDHFPKFPGRTKLKLANKFGYDLAILRLTVIINLLINFKLFQLDSVLCNGILK